jgi:glycosyltransferase involved in cell wall biosynthesis
MDTLGVAIIAKNEEKNLPRLLESIDGAFQRAVLLDTGSTDSTIDIFSAWAREQAGMTFSVASWEWKDDFSDARNAADRLLLWGSTDGGERQPLVDWKCWADCDDIILGATNLRRAASEAKPEVTALFAYYNYAQNDQGDCVIELSRERVIRASYDPWIGRVHEATPISHGVATTLPRDIVMWVHRKQENLADIPHSNERNLRILESWYKDEPKEPRIVGYLGIENMVRGNIPEAIKFFHEYKSLNPGWREEHAQMNRKLAQCYMMSNDPVSAVQAGFDGMAVEPAWPDSYLTMAEAYVMTEEYDKALYWVDQVRGAPNTMLIVNPLDYTYLPQKIRALALGGMGRYDEALEIVGRVQADDYLKAKAREWQAIARREHTANTFVLMAEQLVNHDEQLKALALLDCVPHFAMEHPKVCVLRANVRERLHWANKPEDYADHYEHGGSKPEDFIQDDQIDALCEYLPRTNFLLDGLKEQLETS